MRISRTLLLAPVLALVAGITQAATLELISETGTIADSIGRSTEAALSADGRYVAFLSSAPNLSPGQEDENGAPDVFFHDRVLGTTTLVTHTPGSPARAASPAASGEYRSLDISADGRYVAFSGRGVDLVPGVAGSPLSANVFLWDRVTDATTLVSHAAGSPGTAANDLSLYVRISADGNFVVFTSLAANLVANQADNANPLGGGTADVFLWNRAADTTTLVSRGSGTPAATSAGTSAATSEITGNHTSFNPVISADGGVVAFATFATNLLPAVGDVNGVADVYAWQRSTNTLALVSRAANAHEIAEGAFQDAVAVSADGRYVAFVSRSSNLVPGHADGNPSMPDVFLYDRATDEMRLASRRNDVPFVGGGLLDPADFAMSADGRYVAFSSPATDLVPQVDTNETPDVFVYDRVRERVELASHHRDSATTAASPGSSLSSGRPVFSADGRFLAFQSFAVDLVQGQDTPNNNNVFLYDTASRNVTLVSRTRASAPGSSIAGDRRSFSPVISADGGVVAFLSEATDLGEGQTDPYDFVDLFLYHRPSGEITSPSRRDPDLPPPVTALFSRNVLGGLSADGRLVVFESQGSVFLRDTVADTTARINPPPVLPGRNTSSREALLSADGRFVAFLATQNTPGAAIGLFLHDRAAGTYALVNHAPGSALPGSQPDGAATSNLALSPDGRWVAYQCEGCGLVSGHSPSPRLQEIFLYDRLSGVNILVSRAADTSLPAFPANGESSAPAISADGRHVVFWSNATNLVPGQIDFTGTRDLFVFDREAGPAGSTLLITHLPGSPDRSATVLAPPSSELPAPAVLSEDGRFIAFQSPLPNLVDGQVDANGQGDVFLYNQGTRASILVSHAASSPTPAVTAGNRVSLPEVSMSADGRFLVYGSLATNLAAGVADTNNAEDVILYDRLLGTNSLVSYDGSVPLVAANGASRNPRISADGHRVAFLSGAANLIPGPTQGQSAPTGWYNLYVQDPLGGTRAFIAQAFRDPRPFVPFPIEGPQDDPRVFVTHLSANGRRIAFNSEAALVPGDYNSTWDVYLWDQDGTAEPEGPIPVPPCKLLDTRRRADRPVLTSNAQRIFLVHGACGVPATAKQVVVKVTVFNPSGKGNLRFYPGAATANPTAILRFERGTTRAETFTLPLGTNGTLTVLPFVANRGTVHAAVEVNGYF